MVGDPMCGICGLINFDGQPAERHTLHAMNLRMLHRGPDGAGFYQDGALGLAMRRLNVIDVAGSDQPLYNEDRSVVVVFNGEIYNYRELRRVLIARGHRFGTDGDGETIAHLYEDYGADCFSHLRGMFAIALWDKAERKLLLARDRMGQKPLYFYRDARRFIFASEIKAILAHPDAPRESRFKSDPTALAQYLAYGYVPTPRTAFRDIFMLPPATVMQIDADGKTRQRAYWTLPPGAPPDQNARPETYIAPLRERLDEAVKLRLISDVPLGAFLSGGLDSSLIVALMRRHSSAPIRTYSIGFSGDDSFDESPYARQVARHLGTTHESFHVQPDAIGLLSELVWHHDQPFADSSAIPTYLVSRLTRAHVTVALTGDGGDELFAGYERFHAAGLMHGMRHLPSGFWRALSLLPSLLPEGVGYRDLVKRARRFAHAAGMPLSDAYFDLVRVFSADMIAELSAAETMPQVDFSPHIVQPTHPIAGLLDANMRTYLPDDLLIKADRCSMAASLEARAPFLDHELVEYAAGIPLNLKLKGGLTKYILKEAARGSLPDAIIERKKHGFGVPLGAWLRRDMRPARDMLLSREARGRGFFDMRAVQRLIDAHASGKRDTSRQLWALLTLEAWQRQFIDQAIAN